MRLLLSAFERAVLGVIGCVEGCTVELMAVTVTNTIEISPNAEEL